MPRIRRLTEGQRIRRKRRAQRRFKAVAQGAARILKVQPLMVAGVAGILLLALSAAWLLRSPPSGEIAHLPSSAVTAAPPPVPSTAPRPDFARTGPESISPAAGVSTTAEPPPAPIETPPWLRNAVAIAPADGRPIVAVVMDDLGLNRRNTARAIDLPGPLTLAFMTYAPDVAAQAAAARQAGHELLVHVPMQPAAGIDAGMRVLNADLAPGELDRRIDWALSRFDGNVGINNHMGSRFTASVEGMSALLAELRRRGLAFLDSRTTNETVAGRLARQLGVPFAERDVFLDNEQSADQVERQLAELERQARQAGYAVAIGHPHDATIEALASWLPTLAEKGITLVPVSAIMKHNLEVSPPVEFDRRGS